ncbi:hypothetical protein ACLI09_12770 [Flavobacterium sp. RHBU_24]|uniref:hypothetical protein n=1 Tax=Flavobacterium sp. RHBU_24 TaxID=3391185 RepID=UPI00398498C1
MKKDIEQQLQETLGNRSITPSADAWERLALNRQRTQKENTNKKRAFYYYAAAVAVFFMAGGYAFFSMNNKAAAPITNPQVVNTEKPAENIPTKAVAVPQEESAAVIENPVFPQKQNAVVVKAFVPKEKTQQQNLIIENKGVANTDDTQLATVVVTPPAAVSKDAEAEYLLANATKNIALSKEKAKATNDTALLKEVETEMDDYYRDKAMKVFALKHKTIRFAVNKQ